MKRVCFYHAGCPDGFGAAWAVWRAWGDRARYVPLGHNDCLDASDYTGAEVVFVDIAPPNESLRELAGHAAHLVVLDHHVSSRDRFAADPSLENILLEGGHHVEFDLSHSGAVLSWRHFHAPEETPELLRYVEDQDLWSWKLPSAREVNATIGSFPQNFEAWESLGRRAPAELAREGEAILRSQRREIDVAIRSAHPVRVGGLRVEAVNALQRRSFIGHELARRAAYGEPCGAVYRLAGDRVLISLYSIGAFDVARLAASHGGGGHVNAAGFQVTLQEWLKDFL